MSIQLQLLLRFFNFSFKIVLVEVFLRIEDNMGITKYQQSVNVNKDNTVQQIIDLLGYQPQNIKQIYFLRDNIPVDIQLNQTVEQVFYDPNQPKQIQMLIFNSQEYSKQKSEQNDLLNQIQQTDCQQLEQVFEELYQTYNKCYTENPIVQQPFYFKIPLSTDETLQLAKQLLYKYDLQCEILSAVFLYPLQSIDLIEIVDSYLCQMRSINYEYVKPPKQVLLVLVQQNLGYSVIFCDQYRILSCIPVKYTLRVDTSDVNKQNCLLNVLQLNKYVQNQSGYQHLNQIKYQKYEQAYFTENTQFHVLQIDGIAISFRIDQDYLEGLKFLCQQISLQLNKKIPIKKDNQEILIPPIYGKLQSVELWQEINQKCHFDYENEVIKHARKQLKGQLDLFAVNDDKVNFLPLTFIFQLACYEQTFASDILMQFEKMFENVPYDEFQTVLQCTQIIKQILCSNCLLSKIKQFDNEIIYKISLMFDKTNEQISQEYKKVYQQFNQYLRLYKNYEQVKQYENKEFEVFKKNTPEKYNNNQILKIFYLQVDNYNNAINNYQYIIQIPQNTNIQRLQESLLFICSVYLGDKIQPIENKEEGNLINDIIVQIKQIHDQFQGIDIKILKHIFVDDDVMSIVLYSIHQSDQAQQLDDESNQETNQLTLSNKFVFEEDNQPLEPQKLNCNSPYLIRGYQEGKQHRSTQGANFIKLVNFTEIDKQQQLVEEAVQNQQTNNQNTEKQKKKDKDQEDNEEQIDNQEQKELHKYIVAQQSDYYYYYVDTQTLQPIYKTEFVQTENDQVYQLPQDYFLVIQKVEKQKYLTNSLDVDYASYLLTQFYQEDLIKIIQNILNSMVSEQSSLTYYQYQFQSFVLFTPIIYLLGQQQLKDIKPEEIETYYKNLMCQYIFFKDIPEDNTFMSQDIIVPEYTVKNSLFDLICLHEGNRLDEIHEEVEEGEQMFQDVCDWTLDALTINLCEKFNEPLFQQKEKDMYKEEAQKLFKRIKEIEDQVDGEKNDILKDKRDLLNSISTVLHKACNTCILHSQLVDDLNQMMIQHLDIQIDKENYSQKNQNLIDSLVPQLSVK